MRVTKQRNLILDIVNNSKNHLSAEEIHKESLKAIKNISLGTVYRNLNNLVNENLIKKIKFEEFDRYDQINIKHNHMFCTKCHKIVDIFEDIKISLDNKFGKVNDYEVNFVRRHSDGKIKEEQHA